MGGIINDIKELTNMPKQRMIVYDDQLLVDMEFIFNAIREENGDWQKVEGEMRDYLATVQAMSGKQG
jgi:hypothetical protein